MLEWWQTLPLRLDPIAFSIGIFSIYWYAVFLIMGAACSFFLLQRLSRQNAIPVLERKALEDIFFFCLLGAFLGGKIGYIVLYAGSEFLANPRQFFSPYNVAGDWAGWPGMSYHGAVLGVFAALFFLHRKKVCSFWRGADLFSLVAPILTFFGRLGNYFTGELFGRATTLPWGVYFPGGTSLRHPSALYEALGEGLVIFGLVLWARKRLTTPGELAFFYLASYSVTRFLLEFFREPDQNRGLYGGFFSLGQILSVAVFTVVFFAWWRRRKKCAILFPVRPGRSSPERK